MKKNLSEQEVIRREKRDSLEGLNIKTYPSESIEINFSSKEILENFTEDKKEEFTNVSIAGRLMSRRIIGSASFAELEDEAGKIQVYFHRDSICPDEDKTMYNKVFKKLLDIGDIIHIEGYVFKTQVGQISIHAEKLKVLSKSLKPLPIVKSTDDKVYDSFDDPEQKYRQRYVDLIVNPDSKRKFIQRAQAVDALRTYFKEDLNCLEVETPTLQPIYGGALAEPFVTHHNALDHQFYLRISNELYLKRLIVGGFKGVFEFAKLFRNEGMSRFHNPEFSSVEVYVAYKDYRWMMDHTEKMIRDVVKATNDRSLTIQVGDNEINFEEPFQKLTMFEAIKKYTGVDIKGKNEEELKTEAEKLGIGIDSTMNKGKIIDAIFGDKCEPNLIQPTFIIDYPVEMSPLAKKHRDDDTLVERFELICNGKEIANAYTELNDPIDQRQRFEEQLKSIDMGAKEYMVLDEDYLRAMEYGMPPTVGLGIGIDRLIMITTNSPSIQDVIFFPHMRPEKFG